MVVALSGAGTASVAFCPPPQRLSLALEVTVMSNFHSWHFDRFCWFWRIPAGTQPLSASVELVSGDKDFLPLWDAQSFLWTPVTLLKLLPQRMLMAAVPVFFLGSDSHI